MCKTYMNGMFRFSERHLKDAFGSFFFFQISYYIPSPHNIKCMILVQCTCICSIIIIPLTFALFACGCFCSTKYIVHAIFRTEPIHPVLFAGEMFSAKQNDGNVRYICLVGVVVLSSYYSHPFLQP